MEGDGVFLLPLPPPPTHTLSHKALVGEDVSDSSHTILDKSVWKIEDWRKAFVTPVAKTYHP